MGESIHEKMMKMHGSDQSGPGMHKGSMAKKLATFETKLKGKRQVAEGTYEFTFEKPEGLHFSAGQHIRMTLIKPPETDAEGDARFLTMASTPQEPNLRFAMRMRDTAFKRVLGRMQPGKKVILQKLLGESPHGSFVLHDDATKPAVFVVGGIGIIPAYAMIKDATERKLPHKLFLFYSNRRPEDAPYLADLRTLAKQNPNFTLIATMTEAEKSAQKWQGETGVIDRALLEKYVTDLQAPIYYSAGLPEMVSAMKAMLAGAGVSEDNIRAEEFTGFNLNQLQNEPAKGRKNYLLVAVLVIGLLTLIGIHTGAFGALSHANLFGSFSLSNPLSYLLIVAILAVVAIKIVMVVKVKRMLHDKQDGQKLSARDVLAAHNPMAAMTHDTQVYTCPMHPDIQRDKPSMCPECGMQLVPSKAKKMDMGEHEAHDKHEGHSPNMFKKKFWLSLLLTIPTLLFSPTVQSWLGLSWEFTGSQYIPAVLGVIIFFYGGMVFLKGAKVELEGRQPGMMTLISMAITVAFGYSLASTFGLVEGMDFWWELATLVTIMLLGHWLEMASVANAQGALKELAKLLPDEAELVADGSTKKVPVSELKVGDLVLVRPGAQIPADGEVVKGESDVNESMLTGESKSVKKMAKSQVVAGTINGSGSLTVRVTKIGDDTALAGIMKLVAEAQSSKSKTQILADKAAFYLTFAAIGAAIITWIAWALAGESASFILERIVTVLVIACPHALGLAIPLVTAISTTLAAKNGLLIRQRPALEAARNVDVILFDKTGTLTKGEQGVVDIVSDGDKKQLLTLAAAVENESEHPIAQAIVRSAKEQKLSFAQAGNFSAMSGRGAKANVDGKTVYVGGPRLIEELHANIPEKVQQAATQASEEGKTVVYVIEGKTVRGAIMLADVIREESKEAVATLQAMGKRVAMLTGDSKGVAAWVAKELGIDEYFAEVLPEHKAETVRKLQADGSRVAMVGDGVNDAPALTQADIGIAIGAGTDVAIESAGIVLASSDPRGVAKIVKLSKATYSKMLQNLAWATGYNALAIPLAAGVTAGLGFVLSPTFGAILMSLSTIVVAINAQFLRKLKLQ